MFQRFREIGRWASLAALTGFLGCANNEAELAPAPDAPFNISVFVVSDPGHPLAGAKVLLKERALAVSDNAGLAKVAVAGTEGASVSLAIKCPEGYQAPEKPLVVGLRHLAPGSPSPRFDVRCTPNLRTVVVALRTENGFNLPIVQLGKPIATTNEAGLAHFVMHLRPAEQVTLVLDTSDKASDALRPRSPTLSFVAKDQDELVLLEQKFKVERKRQVVARPVPKPMPL